MRIKFSKINTQWYIFIVIIFLMGFIKRGVEIVF